MNVGTLEHHRGLVPAISLSCLLISAICLSPSAFAAIVTFQLGDHPDAALYQSDPTSPYGLRYDAAPPAGSGPTFSVGTNLGGLGGAVYLTWDDANLAAGATLSGTLERNDDGTFWDVTYVLTGVTSDGNGGIVATGGSGSVDENGGALRSIALSGEQNGSGDAFIFANDGHRLAASTGWVGRGWLLPSGSVDDWLVTAEPVPVPAAVWLFGTALLGLAGAKHRKN